MCLFDRYVVLGISQLVACDSFLQKSVEGKGRGWGEADAFSKTDICQA